MSVAPAASTSKTCPTSSRKETRDRLGIEQGPSRGPANAPVTIVVYQDLMCTYCGKVLGTIDQLLGRVSRASCASS